MQYLLQPFNHPCMSSFLLFTLQQVSLASFFLLDGIPCHLHLGTFPYDALQMFLTNFDSKWQSLVPFSDRILRVQPLSVFIVFLS